jgi:hypothetical protein
VGLMNRARGCPSIYSAMSWIDKHAERPCLEAQKAYQEKYENSHHVPLGSIMISLFLFCGRWKKESDQVKGGEDLAAMGG